MSGFIDKIRNFIKNRDMKEKRSVVNFKHYSRQIKEKKNE